MPNSDPFTEVRAGPVVRCVVFDMDGVIVDSEPAHEAANRAVSGTLGKTDVDDLLESMVGRRVRDLTEEVARRTGEDPKAVLARREETFWRLVRAELRPQAGLAECLDRLEAAGRRLAVASSGTREYIAHVLTTLRVRDRFEVVVSGEDVVHSKPDPEIYRLAAERLEVPAEVCAAVEDAPNGVISAAAAGMHVIAVPHGPTVGKDFTGAHVVVPDLNSAINHLLGS